MAWTTPATWTNGALSAAAMNAQIRDNLTWLKDADTTHGITSDSTIGFLKSAAYSASAYRSSNLSVPTATTTTITLPSEYKDTNGFHSTVADTQQHVIPAGGGGGYLVGYTVEYSANATGDRWVRLLVNGANVDWGTSRHRATSANVTTVTAVTYWYNAAATDILSMTAFQNSGSTIEVSYANLWLVRLFAA